MLFVEKRRAKGRVVQVRPADVDEEIKARLRSRHNGEARSVTIVGASAQSRDRSAPRLRDILFHDSKPGEATQLCEGGKAGMSVELDSANFVVTTFMGQRIAGPETRE